MKKRLFFFILCLNVYYQAFTQDKNSEIKLAENYYRKASDFNNRFQWDSAAIFYQNSAEIFKKYSIWKNFVIAKTFASGAFLQKSDFKNVKISLDTAEHIALKNLGEKNEMLTFIYKFRGQYFFLNSNLDSSIYFFEKAKQLRIEISGEKNKFLPELYNALGNAHSGKGNFQIALNFYLKDIALSEELFGRNSSNLAATYNNIAVIYNNKGEYDVALEYFNKALSITKQQNGENHPNTATLYYGIGDIFQKKGEFDVAMEYFMKSLTIRKQIFNENHPLIADNYISVGQIYKEKKEFSQATQYFSQALDILEKIFGKEHSNLIPVLTNLAQVYQNQKKNSEAIEFYQKALNISQEENLRTADIYNNIGAFYFSQKNFDEALKNYFVALKIYEKIAGNKTPLTTVANLNIANIFYQRKNVEEALKYFQNALISNVKDFSSQDVSQNPTIKNYYLPQILLKTLQGKAMLWTQKSISENGNIQALQNALQIYLSCDTLISHIRKATTSKNDKLLVGEMASLVYENAVESCKLLYFLTKEKKYIEQAFYFSEKNKAESLLEAVAAADAQKFAGIPDSLLEAEKKLKEKIAGCEKEIATLADETLEPFLRSQLFDLNRQYENLISKMEKEFPSYFALKYQSKSATISQLQTLLDDKTAIRSYFLADSLLTIFTISKNEIRMDTSQRVKNLPLKIAHFRRAIVSGKSKDVKQYQADAFYLYQYLFPVPLSAEIKNLIIIPDDVLGMIPFESLLTDEHSGNWKEFKKYPYLIKQFCISYSYSANLLYQSAKNISKTQYLTDFLSLAPIFDSIETVYDDMEVSSLPASESEILSITENFKSKNLKTDHFLRREANESFAKSGVLRNYRFLHFATHGFVNIAKPELSGLILARNDTLNDGILYTNELYNLQLNSDLVILSACETGLGKISKGEGIIGISRALLFAGTKNIIVSLWSVADESTSDLMIKFYSNLLTNYSEKLNFAEFLHLAKLKIIEEEKYAAPFYWSPFILIGK